MAFLIPQDAPERTKTIFERLVSIRFPAISGKFGFSLMLGKKEIFIGIAVAEIEIEKVIKRKKIRVMANQAKGKVRTLTF